VPWTTDQPPAAMRRLPPAVRSKAVEIANALLRDGVDEGRAIRIAIAAAKAWVVRHAASGVWPDRNAA